MTNDDSSIQRELHSLRENIRLLAGQQDHNRAELKEFSESFDTTFSMSMSAMDARIAGLAAKVTTAAAMDPSTEIDLCRGVTLLLKQYADLRTAVEYLRDSYIRHLEDEAQRFTQLLELQERLVKALDRQVAFTSKLADTVTAGR